MTSQGFAHGRFTRSIQQRNLWATETPLRDLGQVSLEDALSYLDLVAEQRGPFSTRTEQPTGGARSSAEVLLEEHPRERKIADTKDEAVRQALTGGAS